MSTHTVDWHFQRVDADGDGRLVDIVVEYEIEPYVPGKLSGPPEDCYPAEGGCVTTMIAYRNDDAREVFELTGEETQEITDWIERNHDHDAGRYPDPDAAYDAWRDDEMDRDSSPNMGWDD